VCYPLPATNLEIDYVALEDYIRLEQIKTQKMMSTSENGATKIPRGPQARAKSATGGLFSKLRGGSFTSSTPLSTKSAQDANYGSIPGKNFGIPERSYSLFGERDKTQVSIHPRTTGDIKWAKKENQLANKERCPLFFLVAQFRSRWTMPIDLHSIRQLQLLCTRKHWARFPRGARLYPTCCKQDIFGWMS
jgi:hypothetical protein